jgi:hypothetical protein
MNSMAHVCSGLVALGISSLTFAQHLLLASDYVELK